MPLGAVVGARDRVLVGTRGLGKTAQAPEQIGADGVEHMRVAQRLTVETVDDRQRRRRSRGLGDRDGAVEGDDRAGRAREQLIVKLQDLRPVGGGGDGRVAVDGVDRRLDLVRAGLIAA